MKTRACGAIFCAAVTLLAVTAGSGQTTPRSISTGLPDSRVLAAAAERNKTVFDGLVAFGLGDENAIAWHLSDNLISLVRKVNEPTFRASSNMANIAPLPFFMIQSSHDEYTSLDEANRLFALARQPKRFALVEGRNHRFDGNLDDFFRTLREGLQWVGQVR